MHPLELSNLQARTAGLITELNGELLPRATPGPNRRRVTSSVGARFLGDG